MILKCNWLLLFLYQIKSTTMTDLAQLDQFLFPESNQDQNQQNTPSLSQSSLNEESPRIWKLLPSQLEQFPLATNQDQSSIQKSTRELLENNWTSWQQLLLDMVEDSYKAVTQNNNWDVIADYKWRAKIKKDILEAAWIFKPAWWVTVNFFTQIYWWGWWATAWSKPWEQWTVVDW